MRRFAFYLTAPIFTALVALGLANCPAPWLASARAEEPYVDTWFEPTEHSTVFLALASRVGIPAVYEGSSAERLCPKDSYRRLLIETRLDWRDPQVAGEKLSCGQEAYGDSCYASASQTLRISKAVWSQARTNGQRLKIAVQALLGACSPGTSPSEEDKRERAAAELIDRLRDYLRRLDDDPSIEDPLEGHRGLIYLRQSQQSRAEFTLDLDHLGYSLDYKVLHAGAGLALNHNSNGISAAPMVSGFAHALSGAPRGGENDRQAMISFLGHAEYMGYSKPVYTISADAAVGVYNGSMSFWLAARIDKLKDWQSWEAIVRAGFGLPTAFIKLGNKSYLLIELGASFGIWKLPALKPNGDSLGMNTLGGLGNAVLRLGDFLLAADSHLDVSSSQSGAPRRFDVTTSLSIPLRKLLSNDYLRIELSRTVVSGGQIFLKDAAGTVYDVPEASANMANVLYEGRF